MYQADVSNLQSVAAAQYYVEQAAIPGHWGEELHGLDYLVYTYLQRGNNKKAKELVDYTNAIKVVYPDDFKTACSFAAIPSRYVLENKNWREAAILQLPTKQWVISPAFSSLYFLTHSFIPSEFGSGTAALIFKKVIHQLKN